jgi:glycosyltransferase involved in cell wall biosynthesis
MRIAIVGPVQRCDLELRSTMGRNGRAWVEQLFAWEVIAETARRHYQSAGDAT